MFYVAGTASRLLGAHDGEVQTALTTAHPSPTQRAANQEEHEVGESVRQTERGKPSCLV